MLATISPALISFSTTRKYSRHSVLEIVGPSSFTIVMVFEFIS